MARDEKRRSIRDRVRQDAAEVGSGSGGGGYIRLPQGMEFVEVKSGTNEIDILCYEVQSNSNPKADPGELFYRREYMVHRDVGAEKKRYICPRSIKKKCPICEYKDELAKDYKANEKLVKDLKPQIKDLFYVDVDGKGKKFGVLDFSHHNFTKKLLEEVREGDEDWGGFSDLVQGYTLKARFVEESFAGNKYLECTRVDFISREDYPESVLDQLPDMDTLLHVLSYDELNKIFLELEDEPEEKPASRGERTGRRPAVQDDPPKDDEPPARERGRRQPDPEPEPEPRGRRGRTEEPPPEEEPPARGRRGRDAEPEPEKPARGRGSEKSSDNPCPHGYEFGVDGDSKPECETCKVWEGCMDRKDEIAAERKAAGRRR